MSRIKLIILLIILFAVGILLGQNRQLLALKFFCPDVTSQDCFYRTSDLPLAVWMATFLVAGILSSLILQLLNRLANNSYRPKESGKSQRKARPSETTTDRPPRKPRFRKTPVKSPPQNFQRSDWDEEASQDWEATDSSKRETQKTTRPKQSQKSPTPKDSVYTYNFSETPKSNDVKPQDSEATKDTTRDDVYDAPYRTVNSPNSPPNISSNEIDDEEQWI